MLCYVMLLCLIGWLLMIKLMGNKHHKALTLSHATHDVHGFLTQNLCLLQCPNPYKLSQS